MHEHHTGCGHLPEDHDHRQHEQLHHAAKELGNLCMSGHCHHPEHRELRDHLVDFEAQLHHESTMAEQFGAVTMKQNYPEIELKVKEKKKKSKTRQHWLAKLLLQSSAKAI